MMFLNRDCPLLHLQVSLQVHLLMHVQLQRAVVAHPTTDSACDPVAPLVSPLRVHTSLFPFSPLKTQMNCTTTATPHSPMHLFLTKDYMPGTQNRSYDYAILPGHCATSFLHPYRPINNCLEKVYQDNREYLIMLFCP